MWKALFLLAFCLLCVCATAGFSGDYKDVQVDDIDVLNTADFASFELSERFPSIYHSKILKVMKAQKKVVDGQSYYRLWIIVGMTNCKKTEIFYSGVNDCDFQEGTGTYKKCVVAVHTNLAGEYQPIVSSCHLANKNDL